jgi:oxepin-CoA hydrolase/3-oxo-5,6-dehydrosuberyl-CoA semialdehyde dehydrogenase
MLPEACPMIDVESFAAGAWFGPGDRAAVVASAIDGEPVARVGGATLPLQQMLDFARGRGGPALRAMTFRERAAMLKALAAALTAGKDGLYALAFDTGATRIDSAIDIEGGIGTLAAYASLGRRELPDGQVLTEGDVANLSRAGTFRGRHVLTPLQGVAVHINAYNFPVWGMLEKLAPALLAGVPAIVKPATDTSYVTAAAFRLMIAGGLLPQGAVQLLCGSVGDLLDRLGPQDSVGFTGSAQTGFKIKSNPNLIRHSVRVTAEQDSLNASILGPDAAPDTPEFALFIKEAAREMTAKAGQKCTAIRRMLVPAGHARAVAEALSARLAATPPGDPRSESTRLGALVSRRHRADVLERAAMIGREARTIAGDAAAGEIAGLEQGAFMRPILFSCADPDAARAVHETEAFGPVATILPYRDLGHAVAIANRGGGSLALSVMTHDPQVAAKVVAEAGAWHGRIYVNDRDSMAESTGHGAPLAPLVHGGPGRAGGGEELGGIRGVLHYMQRTAVQGGPAMLSAIGGDWVKGAPVEPATVHPFRLRYGELRIGQSLRTPLREIDLVDIEHFARFTGDTFYAHMDEEAAGANPFFKGRVAHGYLLLSFAAGLFVDPAPGPVLANGGLDRLRFLKPVKPGDAIGVELVVRDKSPRNEQYGEVRWDATIRNRAGEAVAEYELLTFNAL